MMARPSSTAWTWTATSGVAQDSLQGEPQRDQAGGGGLPGGREQTARERLDDLDVALDLRLGAARPEHYATARQPEDQHVGRRRAGGPGALGEVDDGGHGLAGQLSRGIGPEPAHDLGLVTGPQSELGRQVNAVPGLQL